MTYKEMAFWRSEQTLGVFVLFLCLALQSSLNFFVGWEQFFFQFATTFSTPPTRAFEPGWGPGLAFTATALAGLYIAWVLPQLSAGWASAISLGLVAGVLLLEFWALTVLNLWFKLVFPATLLGLPFAARWLHRLLATPLAPVQQKLASEQTDRMMGLALQGQGQLDMAFERFQRMPMTATLAADLYWLAMDYERQQRFDKARAAYAYIGAFDANFKDVPERLANAAAATQMPPASAAISAPLDAPQITPESGQALGRYRIESKLGKGAMGMVFLAKDPKIGRRVALKTMALSQTFDGLELVDARDRFFREAKAAGCLQHPGIVTIFDVGEEQGLAYIAMEYVTGQNLQPHCKPGQLMPLPRVVSIVARVAQALAYAHKNKVIHRDIKPANVMYDLVTDTVKVTDFGIARITDGNKTKTGVVLGTPNYMSPEQLTGRTVDGRSDLYALGTMLFQLLVGALPFKATTISELMAKITTEPAPDVRQFRAEIPEDLARIVARLLEKSPEKRYQHGEKLALDLTLFATRVQSHVSCVGSTPSVQVACRATVPIDLEL